MQKKIAEKLVEECTEIVKKVKIVSENRNKCSSCVLYIVLFSILFAISTVIGVYFVYYKYMNHNKENISKDDYIYQTKNYWSYKMVKREKLSK